MPRAQGFYPSLNLSLSIDNIGNWRSDYSYVISNISLNLPIIKFIDENIINTHLLFIF